MGPSFAALGEPPSYQGAGAGIGARVVPGAVPAQSPHCAAEEELVRVAAAAAGDFPLALLARLSLWLRERRNSSLHPQAQVRRQLTATLGLVA